MFNQKVNIQRNVDKDKDGYIIIIHVNIYSGDTVMSKARNCYKPRFVDQ